MITLEPLDKLIDVLVHLPGVGRRSAERMALRLARDTRGLIPELVAALQAVSSQVKACARCGHLTLRTEDPCRLCTDPRRENNVLCVVEDPSDILLIERSGAFRGRYHALMGKISPMKGEGAIPPRMAPLMRRVEQEHIREVILALNSDVESDATAAFIQQALAAQKVRITRLALGIPAGSAIAYADALTLTRSIQGRNVLQDR